MEKVKRTGYKVPPELYAKHDEYKSYVSPVPREKLIKPYTAIALQVGYPLDIKKRDDVKEIAIPHIERLVRYCLMVADMQAPTRLIALPEGALTGWVEYAYDRTTFTREIAAESVPGEVTELLGERIAKRYDTYVAGCIKARDDDLIKDRYFNIAFLIDPHGKVILKHYKLQLVVEEGSTTPQDIWDRYTAKYGDGPEAFFQVADTDIGRMGLTICMEGSYPEIYRGYYIQGAEVMYRPSYFVVPYLASSTGTSYWEIQNRARALDNNCYMICPNDGPKYGAKERGEVASGGGYSMIVNYLGQVLSEATYALEGYACAKINIEELRDHRERCTPITNFLPQLRTEYYKRIYEKPIFKKNLFLSDPLPDGTVIQQWSWFRQSVERLQKERIFLTPSVY